MIKPYQPTTGLWISSNMT